MGVLTKKGLKELFGMVGFIDGDKITATQLTDRLFEMLQSAYNQGRIDEAEERKKREEAAKDLINKIRRKYGRNRGSEGESDKSWHPVCSQSFGVQSKYWGM